MAGEAEEAYGLSVTIVRMLRRLAEIDDHLARKQT